MLVYRVALRRFARDLSGEGARRAVGRWNSIGVPMLYAAANPAQALMEVFVYTLGLPAIKQLALITLKLPPVKGVKKITPAGLPNDWNTPFGSPRTREIGDLFAAEGKALVLKVPSALLPTEFNLLINPRHKLASKIEIISVEDLTIDARFLQLQRT